MSERLGLRAATAQRQNGGPVKLTRQQRKARSTLVMDEPPEIHPPYLAAGTHILTEEGEKKIEALEPGELVVLNEGETGRVEAVHPHPLDPESLIVRIRAGALATGLPERDLRVSPDQGLYFDGSLLRAADLLDGMSIQFEPAGAARFYRLVLAQHGIVLAEGTALESYLDRAAPRIHRQKAAAPLLTAGPALADIRGRLHARKLMVGYTVVTLPALEFHIETAMIKTEAVDGVATLNIPPGITQAVLHSATFIPSETDPASTDHRRLGVAISDVLVDDRLVPIESVLAPADTYRRGPSDDITWTRGSARLTLPAGAAVLTLRIAALPRAWAGPGRK